MPTPDVSQIIRDTFDTVSDGYDREELRFFTASARHMAASLDLAGDERVLDVACGTGNVALALAEVLPRGHVTGVDFSPGMLAQARRKLAGRPQVALVEGDMQALPWRRHFDALTCAFGIFFVPDMDKQLRHMAGVVRPGGRISLTCFTADYMQPMRGMFVERLAGYGVQPPPAQWLSIADEAGARRLCAEAGLADIRIERRNLGYFLPDAEAWWQVVWNAGFRRLITGLSEGDRARFQREHLAEIEALRTPEGIRMDIGVQFMRATVPA